MYVIALDEQGNFEYPNNEEKMVAGLIYYGSESDVAEERKRIEIYLRMLCDEVNRDLKARNRSIPNDKLCSYPEDLHLRNSDTPDSRGRRQVINGKNVNDLKTRMAQTIGEFMTSGSFRGTPIREYQLPYENYPRHLSPRAGRYSIYSNLCSRYGKEKLLGPHVGKLVKDDFASNLYIHMAEDVISRLLFHNPLYEMDHVRLNLATRSLPADEESGQRELGMRMNDHMMYSITNQDTYRSAIGREMLASGKVNIDIDLNVTSIRYYESRKNPEDMVFLYLADMVCSVLTAKQGTYNDHNDFLNSNDSSRMDYLVKQAKLLTGSPSLVFGYDAADEFFSNAWKAMENGDYFRSLSCAYDGINYRSSKGGFTKYYKTRWYPALYERITSEANTQYLRIAVRNLRDYSLEQHLSQDKLLYIYSRLKEIIEAQNGLPSDILFNLYDVGHTAYNHIGDPVHAAECYEMSKAYGDGADIETWIDTRNRGIVTMSDAFQYDSLLQEAEDNAEMQKMVDELRSDQFTGSTHMTKSGFAFSQLGQVQALLHMPEAEQSFHEALKLLKENEQEYKKTLSYLLHYYIDSGNQAKYQKEAVAYFGGHTTLREQYHYLLQQAVLGKDAELSANYGLYVFVKAYMTFYPDGYQNFKLPDVVSAFSSACGGAFVKGHPWEIICKYLALNELHNNKKANAKKQMAAANSALENAGFTIDAIKSFGEIQYYDALGDKKERDTRVKELYSAVFHKESDDIETMYDELKRTIHYMYS